MGDTSGLYACFETAKKYFAEKDYLNAAIEAYWCRMYCMYGEPYGISDIKSYERVASKIYFNSIKRLRFSVLSKSMFIVGSQCEKALWLHKYKYKERKVSSETQHKFDRGHVVGKLAQHLFFGGVDASSIWCGECYVDNTKMSLPFHLKQQCWIAKTQSALPNNVPIYEAAFIYDDVFAAVDILIKSDKGFVAYEVKSSTAITETYLLDNALQYYVISHNIKLVDFVLVHLDEEYVTEINIPLDQLTFANCDINRLFVKTSVLDKVLPLQERVRDDIVRFKQTLANGEPTIKQGEHCNVPYECAFIDYCRRH